MKSSKPPVKVVVRVVVVLVMMQGANSLPELEPPKIGYIKAEDFEEITESERHKAILKKFADDAQIGEAERKEYTDSLYNLSANQLAKQLELLGDAYGINL